MNHVTIRPSKEDLVTMGKEIKALAEAVRAGSIPIEEAAEILTKPPYNIRGIYRARHLLNPGPPAP
jgi:hypothetical protein